MDGWGTEREGVDGRFVEVNMGAIQTGFDLLGIWVRAEGVGLLRIIACAQFKLFYYAPGYLVS